jgi:hypothetical protein
MQAIIYVVDSTDTERISISREEFHAILEEEELKDALILVYANKQARHIVQEGKLANLQGSTDVPAMPAIPGACYSLPSLKCTTGDDRDLPCGVRAGLAWSTVRCSDSRGPGPT